MLYIVGTLLLNSYHIMIADQPFFPVSKASCIGWSLKEYTPGPKLWHDIVIEIADWSRSRLDNSCRTRHDVSKSDYQRRICTVCTHRTPHFIHSLGPPIIPCPSSQIAANYCMEPTQLATIQGTQHTNIIPPLQ